MSRLPIAGPSLARRLRQQERTATREANASAFSRSGSGVTDVDEVTYEGVLKILGQMVVDGTLVVNGLATSADFDGDLDTGDAGTTGWAMNAARVAIGELLLRPGSVGNDALANPVAFGGDSDQVQVYALAPSSTMATAVTVSIPAPAWATSCQVLASAAINMSSPLGEDSGLITQVVIDGDASSIRGRGGSVAIDADWPQFHQRTYDPGATVSASVQWKNGDTDSLTAAFAALTVTVLFTR